MKRLILFSALMLSFVCHSGAMSSNEPETIPLSSDIIEKSFVRFLCRLIGD